MAWTEQDSKALEEALKDSGLSNEEVKKAMSAPEPKEHDPNAQCVTQQDMDCLRQKIEQKTTPNSSIWKRRKKR